MGMVHWESFRKDIRIFLAGGLPAALSLGFFVPFLLRECATSYHLFFIILIGVPLFISLVLLQERKLGTVALFLLGIIGYGFAFYNLLSA